MIIAETLKRLINYDGAQITQLIQQAGYKYDRFTGAKFLGITNSGDFCYMAVYPVESGGTDSVKVFVNYDPTTGMVTADYWLTLLEIEVIIHT